MVAPEEQAPRPAGSDDDPPPSDHRTGWGDVAIEVVRAIKHVFDRLVDDVFGDEKKFPDFVTFLRMLAHYLGVAVVALLVWRGLDGVVADAYKLLWAGGSGAAVAALAYLKRGVQWWLGRRAVAVDAPPPGAGTTADAERPEGGSAPRAGTPGEAVDAREAGGPAARQVGRGRPPRRRRRRGARRKRKS